MSLARFRRQPIRPSHLLMIGIGISLLLGWVVADEEFLPRRSRRHDEPQATSSPSSLALVQEQVALNPRDWRWSVLLARAQLSQGDRQAAAITLKRLQTLHPNRLEVISLKSLLSLETGSVQPALDQVSQLFQQSAPKQRLELGLLLADLHRQDGNVKAATSTYERLIKDDPSRVEPLLALALLNRDQGNGNQALALLSQAERLGDDERLQPNNLSSIRLNWALEAARNKTTRAPQVR
jgi:tetratricopeptide (TPR) repeat protein